MSAGISDSPATTTTIHDLHSDVLTRTLRLLDGRSLSAVCSVTSRLRSVSSQSHLWIHLCLSTFPSLNHPLTLPFLSSSPRAFFSDAFPFPSTAGAGAGAGDPHLPKNLISAVDIHHRGAHIFSKIIQTETSSPWFLGSPFLIDAMEQKSESMISISTSPEDLTLSWILIDPAIGRAVNVSTRRSVGIERNCYTGETMVRFAMVMGEMVIGAVVICGEGTGQVRDVMLMAEDIDGACVSGREAVGIVKGMMEEGRNGGGRFEEEEMRERYLGFLRRKRRRKESRARREGVLDLCCTAVGVAVFLGFMSIIVFR